jgi:glycosyltransferase involved in cell wall biosynthesis
VRILHVVATAQQRGGETFASDLIRALNRKGVVQRVAILRDSNSRSITFDAETWPLANNGRRLPGIKVNAGAIRRLARLIREWDPHLVQLHGGEALKHAAIAALGSPSRLIYRRIGTVPHRVSRGLRRKAHASLMRRAARIVTVAEVLKRETVELFRVPEGRIVTIPNGVDPDRIRPQKGRDATRASLGISVDATVLLSLGALSWEKNPIGQLKIAASVLRKSPSAAYLVAGDGSMRAEVERAVNRMGLEGRVFLAGLRDDIGDVLAASDALLLASWMEGMPASVIEAGMLGIPVAAYSVAGVPHVVLDEVTGLLAPPGDQDRLESCVLKLVTDHGARAGMGRSARLRCRSLFGIETIAARYLAVYEETLGAS